MFELKDYIVKSQAVLKAMTEDELVELKLANEQIKKENDKLVSEAMLKSSKELEGLKGVLEVQGKELTSLKTKGSTVTVADTIIKRKENVDTFVKDYRTKGSSKLKLEVKAVTGASVAGSTLSFGEPDVGRIPTRKTFLSSLFRKVNLGSNAGGSITYIDEDTVARNADNVASCTPVPESDITWIENKTDVKKIGDSLHVCKDVLEDYDFIQSEIDVFLQTNMMLKLDQQLLKGDGTLLQFGGIDSFAQTFSVGAGSPIESLANQFYMANTYDVITASINQVENSGQNNAYSVNAILMHPNDIAILSGEKDANGNYLIPPQMSATGGIFIKGIPVIASQLITENTLYVGDFSKATMYVLRDLELDLTNSHGELFTSQISVIIATLRACLVVKNANKNAFLKVDDVSAAKIALNKV
jgi:HK97 family phage major capsid protein